MIPIYRGFDGLDVSFRAQIPPRLSDELEAAKGFAQSTHQEVCLNFAGRKMLVSESGARGGYAYRVSTGKRGATWFFKRPNVRDPWGIRVSCGSFMLAELGLGQTRAELYSFMDQLGINVPGGAESISRVDYAVDVLAPNFALNPDQFVMHSNTGRADYIAPDEMSVHGKSGRVTSVTIGKMPGRQVIVYDKRAEVIAHHKWAWFDIWNANCERIGMPPLDSSNPECSRVWRIELRAGKAQLKDRWNIRTWADLDNRLGDMIAETATAVRHTMFSHDTNRARWAESELWKQVRLQLDEDLVEMRNFAPPDTIKRVQQDAHLKLLFDQALGLLISRAAIAGVGFHDLTKFAKSEGERLVSELVSRPGHFEKKLEDQTERYSVIF